MLVDSAEDLHLMKYTVGKSTVFSTLACSLVQHTTLEYTATMPQAGAHGVTQLNALLFYVSDILTSELVHFQSNSVWVGLNIDFDL